MAIRWVDVFLDRPRALVDEAARFWCAVTGSTVSPWRVGHTFATLEPADGDAWLRLQAVDDLGPRGGVHLDLEVDDLLVEADRLRRLGATDVLEGEGLVVLRSPAGLRFCLTPYAATHPRRRTPPVGDPATRLDQVTLDLPATVVAMETAFWEQATGWELLGGSLPQFRVLRPPGWGTAADADPHDAAAVVPVRFLVQQLGDDIGAAGLHVDLACADRVATTAQHEALGASVVVRRDRWTVLRDPAGGTYCLTDRDPVTGTLRP